MSPTRPLRDGSASCGRRRGDDPELANQAEEVGALEAERARGMGAVAAHLVERRFDQPSLELGDGAVVAEAGRGRQRRGHGHRDRKSTRLNSSHSQISYAVFCLKKKKHDSAMRPSGTPSDDLES